MDHFITKTSLRTFMLANRFVWPIKLPEQNIHGLQGKYQVVNEL